MQSTPKVVLDRVTDAQTSPSGKTYFAAYFRLGLFGRSIRRAFFATKADDGDLSWDRASPDALKPLIGQDLSSEVEVHAIEIEPVTYTTQEGEIREATSGRVVKFGDETLAAAARTYGFTLREATAEVVPLVPPGFHVVSGDGAPA